MAKKISYNFLTNLQKKSNKIKKKNSSVSF